MDDRVPERRDSHASSFHGFSLEPESLVEECFDCTARITSKELAITPFCEKWHPPESLF